MPLLNGCDFVTILETGITNLILTTPLRIQYTMDTGSHHRFALLMDNPFFKQLESQAEGYRAKLAEVLPKLRFDDQGLIPVIAQQHDSLEVLMMAWMNRDAITETLTTGRVCYWSRSRQQLWRKGESSGHTQHLVSMRLDCDGDTVLCLVDQKGPACHTNRSNCFYLGVHDDDVEILTDSHLD